MVRLNRREGSRLNLVTRDLSGSIYLETALALVVTLIGVSGLINTSIGLFRLLGLEWTLNRTVRYAVTGPNPLPAIFPTREEAIQARLISNARAIGIILAPSDIKICTATNPGCAPHDAGISGQALKISATFPIQLFFGAPSIQVTRSSVGINE